VPVVKGRGVSPRGHLLIGLAGILVLVILCSVAFYSDDLPIIGGGTAYTADFSEASGLKPGNEVRVAGVKVGKVTGVALAGAHVKVTFKVKDAWIGDATTAAIKIKTLLGDKYVALDPLGLDRQRTDRPIPLSRTTSPYDVEQAFNDLSTTVGKIDTGQLARSLTTLSSAFRNTPPDVRAALTGMSRLSITISSRDTELARLLRGTRQITGTLAGQNGHFTTLLKDGNILLGMLRQRRNAIHGMLVGTTRMSIEISGLVTDNNKQIGPMLRRLDKVTKILSDNQRSLDRALALAGPYYRMVGNTLGNGRWIDAYLCGLVPKNYAPATVPEHGCQPPKGKK
jgi:phospholipid/cholesterol/gamma-HCH transport system substrate-binding protein